MKYKDYLPKIIGKESNQKEFDPHKIFTSLREETDIDIEKAKRITDNVCRFLITNDLKLITPPLIREIVNIELLKLGLEIERLRYTRIGFPYKDLLEMTNKLNSLKFSYKKQEFDNRENIKEIIFKHIITEFKEVKELIKEREKKIAI